MASGLDYRAKQAEHMAAPTKMQSENSSCQPRSRLTHRDKSNWSRCQSRLDLPAVSFAAHDHVGQRFLRSRVSTVYDMLAAPAGFTG